MFKSVGNDSHFEPVLPYVKSGQTDPVKRNRAFFYDQGSEFFREIKAEFPAPVFLFTRLPAVQADRLVLDRVSAIAVTRC